MGRILLINSDDVNQNQIRVKLSNQLEIVTAANLHEFLCTKEYMMLDDRLELLDKQSGRFERMCKFEHFLLDWSSGFISVMIAKTNREAGQVLSIRGRLFDIRDGISIGNDKMIHINEISHANMGTGLNTWDGSVILAKYFENNQEIVKNKCVLELGSGTGVAGIAASMLGASYVQFTDLAYALKNLQYNAENNLLNKSEVSQEMPSNIFDVALLDWSDPQTYEYHLENIQKRLSKGQEYGFDLIIAADVIWLEELVEPLVKCLNFFCASQQTKIVLAHQKRSERTDALLFSMLSQHFTIQQTPTQYHPDFQSEIVKIYEIQRII